MLAIITSIIYLILLGCLAFFRASLKVSTVVIGLFLLFASIFHFWSWWILALAWIIFIVGAVILNLPAIRRDFLSKILLKEYRAILPLMSVTERIALEAGDVWWEGELFRGCPDWKKLLAMPKPELTEAEQAFINNQVEKLCGMLNDWEIVFEHFDLPESVWRYLKQERFFGLVIGKEYGGHGFSAQAHSAIVTQIASRSASAAVNVMVPNSLGPAELIERYGTEQQKKYYLPRLANGEDIPCFALTGPEAGSDAGAIPDTGIVCHGEYKGESIIGMRLNWNK